MSQTILFKKVPFFSNLPRSELEDLASILQIATLQAGEALFPEAKKGESLFIYRSAWRF